MSKRKFVPILVIVFIIIGFIVIYLQVGEEKPDFKAMKNVTERKQAFVDYMLPYINEAEKAVCSQRSVVSSKLAILKSAQKLSTNENDQVTDIAKIYKLKVNNPVTVNELTELLNRVNVIPESLVLAQSALESGWGTSRFAADYNNYFGEHCFTEGCGIKPKNQTPGKIDEVAVFRSPQQSIANYILLLNRSNRYKGLREIRAKLQSQNKPLSSELLINGLGDYSELGLDEYKKRVMSVINYNKFSQYDKISCGTEKQ